MRSLALKFMRNCAVMCQKKLEAVETRIEKVSMPTRENTGKCFVHILRKNPERIYHAAKKTGINPG